MEDASGHDFPLTDKSWLLWVLRFIRTTWGWHSSFWEDCFSNYWTKVGWKWKPTCKCRNLQFLEWPLNAGSRIDTVPIQPHIKNQILQRDYICLQLGTKQRYKDVSKHKLSNLYRKVVGWWRHLTTQSQITSDVWPALWDLKIHCGMQSHINVRSKLAEVRPAEITYCALKPVICVV